MEMSRGSTSEVVIASAFGRGNWLAVELVEKGLNVVLIDVSEHLGRWAPEDWEGPFGLFQSEKISASQLTRLTHEDYHDAIDDGLVVWTNEGPIDFKGLLSNYWLSKNSELEQARIHLAQWDSFKSNQDKQQWIDSVFRMPFSDNWLIHLAHQMASNVFEQNAEGVCYGEPLPLFSSYFVRRVSRRGYQKSLDWCRDKGVKVFSSAQITDVLENGKTWEGLEVKSEWSGALLGENLVWMLSSQESLKLSEKVSEFLFPKGAAEPTWVWMRFRVRMNLAEYRNTVPLKFVLIEDLGLAWTHTNFVLVQRTVKEDDFDCWIRVPTHSRFHRGYLDEQALNLLELLKKKIPFVQPQVLDMPQDYLYEYKDLGPSLFPVFEKDDLKKLKTCGQKNVYFGGPEFGTRLDWTGRFRWQEGILNSLLEWKQKEVAKQEARRDRQVHAP